MKNSRKKFSLEPIELDTPKMIRALGIDPDMDESEKAPIDRLLKSIDKGFIKERVDTCVHFDLDEDRCKKQVHDTTKASIKTSLEITIDDALESLGLSSYVKNGKTYIMPNVSWHDAAELVDDFVKTGKIEPRVWRKQTKSTKDLKREMNAKNDREAVKKVFENIGSHLDMSKTGSPERYRDVYEDNVYGR